MIQRIRRLAVLYSFLIVTKRLKPIIWFHDFLKQLDPNITQTVGKSVFV